VGSAPNSPRVTVFCEDTKQPQQEAYEKVYPLGIGETIAASLRDEGLQVQIAYQSQPENGLSAAVLDVTDVLVYWSHKAWRDISEAVIQRAHERILCGMGFIALHSTLVAPLFRRVLGTTATMRWRNVGELERVWVIDRAHPIAQGLDPFIELADEEMYSEEFDIPTPDDLVFISWFEGGEVFRSGCCWKRGRGKIFYFRPGHETAPTFHNVMVKKILLNSVMWAAPSEQLATLRQNEKAPEAREAALRGRVRP
jgi:trehalose utilization protein